MSSFHSSLFSNRLGKSVRQPAQSIFFRTAPEKGGEKDNQMSLGLLSDFILFYCILAVDSALTAEQFFRSRLGAKGSTSAGQSDDMA